jgi:hypothetical protein
VPLRLRLFSRDLRASSSTRFTATRAFRLRAAPCGSIDADAIGAPSAHCGRSRPSVAAGVATSASSAARSMRRAPSRTISSSTDRASSSGSAGSLTTFRPCLQDLRDPDGRSRGMAPEGRLTPGHGLVTTWRDVGDATGHSLLHPSPSDVSDEQGVLRLTRRKVPRSTHSNHRPLHAAARLVVEPLADLASGRVPAGIDPLGR